MILDVCCGSKMFWFDKGNPLVIFNDIREEKHTLCDGRTLEIEPDTMYDFTDLGFKNESFKMVVFDPPHLLESKSGKNSWMRKKYGGLSDNYKEDLRMGFKECFRVLEPKGFLIFKWNEVHLPVSEILKLAGQEPLFGHKSGKRSNTHWICFTKQ